MAKRILITNDTFGGADDGLGAILMRSFLVSLSHEEQRPLGWARPDDADVTVSEEDLALGGTLCTQGGPLRGALDAALSSPSRRGVIVDEDGVLVGTCRATEVLAAIESRERRHVASGTGR